jgi:murein DD-endopeptidase MepM/ murein hydrolase activator NlpD
VVAYSPTLIEFFSNNEAKEESCFEYKSIFLPPRVNAEEFLLSNLLNGQDLSSIEVSSGFPSKSFFITDSSDSYTDSKGALRNEPVDALRTSSVKIISKGELAGAKFVRGEITSNFYCDARRVGIPAGVIDGVVDKLSSRIDFKHSLKRGDAFEVIYDAKNVMLYAKLVTKRKQAAVYRMENNNDAVYYTENGIKISATTRNNCFAPPLKGRLQITSRFGWRKHPVHRVHQHHSGVDLAAPHGTPVYAVLDGVVNRASRYFGYGNCIDLNHKAGYSSRYAHLCKCSVRGGEKVKKGQLIGYSGSTGCVDGPHLHLEIACNNKVMNPMSVKMIPDVPERIPNMVKFNVRKNLIERISAA